MKEFSLLKKFNWELLNSPIPAPVIPPYKVYSALISQYGGDVPSTTIGDESINKGVTYTIVYLEPGDNLIPYGAPNNQVGTSFVCNKDVSPWGNPASVLSYNQGAPIVNVLENTIGNLWFTYLTDGTYSCNSNGLFTTNKTTGNSEIYYSADNDRVYYMYSKYLDINEFRINSMQDTVSLNDALHDTFLEIRVYN